MLRTAVLFLSFSFSGILSVQYEINWNNLKPTDYLPPFFKDLEENHRIVGGQVAKPNAYPHQVGLELILNSGSRSWCGGSIISKRFVLTAAHCLEKARFATVIMGAHDRESKSEKGRETVRTNYSDFIIHKDFTLETLANDIALIKFGTPIHFTDKIQRIALPSPSDIFKTFDDSKAVITGWGNYGGSGLSKYLRYTESQIIGNKKCREYYGNTIQESIICLDGSRGNGTCYGDSGGPLTIRINNTVILAGLTSFGSPYGCQARWPTAYTRITSFLRWIKRKID